MSVIANPSLRPRRSILMDVVNESSPPPRGDGCFLLVVRVQDLLRHRVETINRAFHSPDPPKPKPSTFTKGVFRSGQSSCGKSVERSMDARPGLSILVLEAGQQTGIIAAFSCSPVAPKAMIILQRLQGSDVLSRMLFFARRKLGQTVIM